MILVRIRFHDWRRSDIHRIHNFGEDLWSAFRYDKRVAIDLGEIDRSRDEIVFRVRRRYLRRAIAQTEAVMARHMIRAEADIFVDDPTTERV